MFAIQSAFPQYQDLDGSPLEAGYLYFGVANQNPETNPITVYWDSAGLIPAAQPIRTESGIPVRNGSFAEVFAATDYSLTVRNRNRELVFAQATCVNDFFQLLGAIGSTLIGWMQAGVGAVLRTVSDRLRDRINIKDFGAKCDGVTDDSAAIALALAYANSLGGATVEMPAGNILCGATTVTTPGGTVLKAGIHFNAAGVGYSKITLRGSVRGGTVLTFTDATNAHGIDISGAGHITLKDFQTAHSGAESTGWAIIGATGVAGAGDSCSNVLIDDAIGGTGFVNGIKLGICTWGLVENCRPGSTTGGGIAFQAGDAAGTASSVITFRQNYIGGSYAKGYYIDRCTDSSVYDPVIENCTRGYELTGNAAGTHTVFRPHFEVVTTPWYCNGASVKVYGGSLTGGTFLGAGLFSSSDTPAYVNDVLTNNWVLPNNASVVPGDVATGVWKSVADNPNGITRNANGKYTILELGLYQIQLNAAFVTTAVASPYSVSVLYGVGTYGEADASLSGNTTETVVGASTLLRIPENSLIEPRVYQNSGAGRTVAASGTTISILKVG